MNHRDYPGRASFSQPARPVPSAVLSRHDGVRVFEHVKIDDCLQVGLARERPSLAAMAAVQARTSG
jgi:hypothetical protein